MQQKAGLEHEPGVPTHLGELRSTVWATLQDPRAKILVPATNAFGDNFLLYRAHYVVLQKFCAKHGLSFNPSSPPIQLDVPEEENVGFPVWSYVQSSIAPFNNVMKTPNRYSRNLAILSHLLGVTLSDDELHALPLPLKMNAGPLKEFDWGKISHRAKELTTELQIKNRKQVTIVQAGSSIWKEFSDDQVVELVAEARKVFPGAHVTVFTAKIFTEHSPEDLPTYGADTVVATPDINEIGAHFAIKDSVIVTTDSFPAWFAAGCQGMQNNGKLPGNTLIDLYTLANSEDWEIPNAYVVESPAVEASRKNRKMSEDGFLIDGGERYRAYWIHIHDEDQRRNATTFNPDAYSLNGIAQGDIELVKNAMHAVAKKPHRAMRRAS